MNPGPLNPPVDETPDEADERDRQVARDLHGIADQPHPRERELHRQGQAPLKADEASARLSLYPTTRRTVRRLPQTGAAT